MRLVGHSFILTALVMSTGTFAFAQEMTPTATQRSYNDRGVQHMFDGEFEEAAANFKSSLSLGESNIALLNYGRALFKLERCQEALAAYNAVPNSPAVGAPSPSEIAVVLDRFTEEWGTTCTATLQLECPGRPTDVQLDSGTPFECHSDPIPVVPGEHIVSVSGWDEPFVVDVVASEPTMLSLIRSVPHDEPATESVNEEREMIAQPTSVKGRSNGRRIAGLAIGATGLAALGTAVALEFAWVQPAFDNYRDAKTPTEWETTRQSARSAQRVNRILLFSGIGAAALGATLFAIPTGNDDIALNIGLSGPTRVTAELKW